MQDSAQQALLVDLAAAMAAAVHAKRIPVQDLLGCTQFTMHAGLASNGKGRPVIAQAFARLVLQTFVDTNGALSVP